MIMVVVAGCLIKTINSNNIQQAFYEHLHLFRSTCHNIAYKDRYSEAEFGIRTLSKLVTLREESSQTNVILQYKLLAAILSAV